MKHAENNTIVSSLTSKYQATVPQAVRKKLGLGQKDKVAFVIGKNAVTLRKATPLDLDYLRGLEHTLEEWNSEHDNKAYHDL